MKEVVCKQSSILRFLGRILVLNNLHQLTCAHLARRAAARAGAQDTARASIDADHVTQVLVLQEAV